MHTYIQRAQKLSNQVLGTTGILDKDCQLEPRILRLLKVIISCNVCINTDHHLQQDVQPRRTVCACVCVCVCVCLYVCVCGVCVCLRV